MTKDAACNEGAKKEVGAVDVGSLEVGPPSASASESWILAVEVAEIDEAGTTHTMKTGRWWTAAQPSLRAQSATCQSEISR